MGKRQLQKEQTREILIKVAYDLFCQKGILATRVSDVAAGAGVSHGTVFVHFETQEALTGAVIETYGGKIAAVTHERAVASKDMAALLSAHLDAIKTHEAFYKRLVLENRLLPTVARDVWVTIQSAVAFHFSAVAAKERQRGNLVNLSDAILFNTWIGLVHHYLLNDDLFAPGAGVIETYKDTLIKSYLKLIRK